MRTAITTSLVLVVLSGVSYAGALATDANAVYWDETLWHGSTLMINGSLRATVDWCVYGPGDFSYPDLGYTPTADEFVYAYQLFVEPNSEIVSFLVGLEVSSAANNIGSWTMAGGEAISSASLPGSPPDQAYWDWSPALQPGELSVGLAFSSAHAPMMGEGLAANHGDTAFGEVPTPSDEIPEPGTLGLIAGGLIAAALRRRRH